MEHGTDKLKCNKMHVILLCNGACCFNKKIKKKVDLKIVVQVPFQERIFCLMITQMYSIIISSL